MEENSCYLCGSKKLNLVEVIKQKPEVEVDYKIPTEVYHREIYRCESCGVFNNLHDLIGKDFYEGFYNNSITKNSFNQRFERIINIPIEQSDNKNRVNRVIKFLQEKIGEITDKEVLDIGSGTCVFLYEMKKHNLKTTCIDPDSQAINHAKDVVKVNHAHHGSLLDFKTTLKYDLICFNKVLEHVKTPIINIKESTKYLSEKGLLYIEMPEGESIFRDNLISKRAEFAVEHYTVYNEKSMKRIAEMCDLELLKLESIIDPSGKRTIYGFYEKNRK